MCVKPAFKDALIHLSTTMFDVALSSPLLYQSLCAAIWSAIFAIVEHLVHLEYCQNIWSW